MFSRPKHILPPLQSLQFHNLICLFSPSALHLSLSPSLDLSLSLSLSSVFYAPVSVQVHTDFPFNSEVRLWRRVNVLLYLNPIWKPEWNGHLELWNSNHTTLVKTIEPLLNRMIIFRTTNSSFHGHPAPLATPPGIYRQSMALYYFTSDIFPGEEMMKATTQFVGDEHLG
jgi:hypothetical protein